MDDLDGKFQQPQGTDGTAGVAQYRRRGRGATSNATSRYDSLAATAFDDGWETLAELPKLKTTLHTDTTRQIITRNTSPDISFDRSINMYRGCEHGCIYCFARPTHCYLGHSAGLDFETQLYVKPDAAHLLKQELAKPSYKCATIALGTNTDPYQPIEKDQLLTRAILETLDACNHPVGIVTKSALIVRDIDILGRMATRGLAKAAISVTTLDRKLARAMEPRATTPQRRLEAISQLAAAGIPAAVMVAPIIPALNDNEIEAILSAARLNGASAAGFVTLRMPLEIKQLFREWLQETYPGRANRIIKLIQSMHGGRDYTAEFGTRQRGTGPYAAQIAQRFHLAAKRLGFDQSRKPLRTDLFRPPIIPGTQLNLL